MKKNVGTVDQIVRLSLALVLFSTYFLLEGNLRFISVVGVIPLLTALFSFCPIYKVFGIDTCKMDKLKG